MRGFIRHPYPSQPKGFLILEFVSERQTALLSVPMLLIAVKQPGNRPDAEHGLVRLFAREVPMTAHQLAYEGAVAPMLGCASIEPTYNPTHAVHASRLGLLTKSPGQLDE